MVDTLHPPVSVILSWPTPNYIDPPTRGPALEVVCLCFGSIAVLVVSMRVYLRVFITKAAGLDDILIILGLGFATAMSVMVIIYDRHLLGGRHIWDIPPALFVAERVNMWVSEWLWMLAGTCIKISVLLFYRRLSVRFSKGFMIATWIGIIYNVLVAVALGLTLLFICQPLNAYWNSFNPIWATTHKFHCGREDISLTAAVGLSLLADYYSTLLPLCLVYTLDMPLRKKIPLYCLFAVGFLACAIGTVRLVILYNLLFKDYDFTWALWRMWIYTVTEVYVAMFAASAPALKPLVSQCLSTIRSLARYSARRSGSTTDDSYVDEKALPVAAGVDRAEIHEESVAETAVENHMRERSFWLDLHRKRIRRFSISSDRHGKLIPVQVSPEPPMPVAPVQVLAKPAIPTITKTSPSLQTSPPLQKDSGRYVNKELPSTPPLAVPLPLAVGKNRPRRRSLDSQQTIHVGLQVESDVTTLVASPPWGSVRAARLRAEYLNARKLTDELATDLPRGEHDVIAMLGALQKTKSLNSTRRVEAQRAVQVLPHSAMRKNSTPAHTYGRSLDALNGIYTQEKRVGFMF